MSEALNCILDFGFSELNLDKIEAFTHRENEDSKRLLEKNGFNLIADRKDEDNISNIIFEIKKARDKTDLFT
jgi:ribosomal-protein-alanine N-acetyltransferase